MVEVEKLGRLACHVTLFSGGGYLLRIESEFERIESKFERIENKFERIENNFERIESKFERIESEIQDN